MEIKFLNINLKKNNIRIKNLNLKIEHNQITGILNDDLDIVSSILTKKNTHVGDVLIDNKSINLYQANLISYIDLISDNIFLTKMVKDEFYLVKRKITNLSQEEYLSKITSTLNLVGLDEKYLERENKSLSNSEKKLVKIALNLVINPDILIFKEPFRDLDKKYITYLKKIIYDLKKDYGKTIIIVSNDIDILYELTNNLIVFKDNNILIADRTSIVFKDLDFLEDNNIECPNLIKFNKIATKYSQDLKNTKDIKDLIKEVYKNVQELKKET